MARVRAKVSAVFGARAASLLPFCAPAVAVAFPLWRYGTNVKTIAEMDLYRNGIVAANYSQFAAYWTPALAPVPVKRWWGEDPTASGSKTTETWLSGGTPAARYTGICPNGSHTSVFTGCTRAIYFDGSNDYYRSQAASLWSPYSNDFSACVLFSTEDQSGWLGGDREGPSGEGWDVRTATASVQMSVESHTGVSLTATFDAHDPTLGAWEFCCLAFDDDLDTHSYCNGVSDGGGATPGGVFAPTTQAYIGTASDVTVDLDGLVGHWFFWPSYLTSAMVYDLWDTFSGVNENSHALPVNYSSSGPDFMMIAGLIEGFGDNWPVIGAELPGGWSAGAGSPSHYFFSGTANTERLLYTRDLTNAVWATGDGTPTKQAASRIFWRDYRQMYEVVDNDGAGLETIKQLVTKTGDAVSVCAWYATDSGSGSLSVDISEQTGGSCGAPSNGYDTVATTTTITHHGWSRTFSDSNCSQYAVHIDPTDHVAASTGFVTIMANAFEGTTPPPCPPSYIEAEATAVGGMDHNLQYEIDGTDWAGGIPNGSLIMLDFTPSMLASDIGDDAYFWEVADSGTAVDYYRAYWGSDDKLYLVGRSTEEGAERVLYVSDSAWTPTFGTVYELKWSIHSSASWVQIDSVGQPGTNVTLSSAPDSLDDFAVCASASGANQPNAWCSSVRIIAR